MVVSSQLHGPAALPLVPTGNLAWWAAEPVRTQWPREKLQASKPGRPVRRLVTILTELPCLCSLWEVPIKWLGGGGSVYLLVSFCFKIFTLPVETNLHLPRVRLLIHI